MQISEECASIALKRYESNAFLAAAQLWFDPQDKETQFIPRRRRIPHHPLQIHTRYANQSRLLWATWESCCTDWSEVFIPKKLTLLPFLCTEESSNHLRCCSWSRMEKWRKGVFKYLVQTIQIPSKLPNLLFKTDHEKMPKGINKNVIYTTDLSLCWSKCLDVWLIGLFLLVGWYFILNKLLDLEAKMTHMDVIIRQNTLRSTRSSCTDVNYYLGLSGLSPSVAQNKICATDLSHSEITPLLILWPSDLEPSHGSWILYCWLDWSLNQTTAKFSVSSSGCSSYFELNKRGHWMTSGEKHFILQTQLRAGMVHNHCGTLLPCFIINYGGWLPVSAVETMAVCAWGWMCVYVCVSVCVCVCVCLALSGPPRIYLRAQSYALV